MKLIIFRIKSFFKKLPELFKSTKVKMVYDSDLDHLIESLGIKTKVADGVFSCRFCNAQINHENLGAIQKDGGDLKFICMKLECLSKL